jgi:glycogen(starch) synthase
MGIRAVEEWGADILHLHTAMLWHVASAIQAITGKPLVYHVHSVDRAEYYLGNEPYPWLALGESQTRAICGADRLIALTRPEEELLIHYYPKIRKRIRVVGNGIEDSEEARAAVSGKFRSGTPKVLYNGRLVERKGIRDLLDAIPIVLQAAPATQFIFAGGPPCLEGDEVAAQWLGSEHEPFRDRIRFTGWLRADHVYSLYKMADILVVPSRYEPFGMVILEGMLHGLPIVAADVGGPAEILEHGRTGLLFPPRDTKALGDALIYLLEHPSERWIMGQAAATEVRYCQRQRPADG